MNPSGPFLALCLAATGVSALGQGGDELRGLPVSKVYEDAGAEVRDAVQSFAQTPDGALLAGSNRLAVLEGGSWKGIDVPGAYGFRGLAAAESTAGRVYVGAIGAVGYVERDATGGWHYVSLLPELRKTGTFDVGDVWQVLADPTHPAHIYWITSDRVLRWDGSTFSAWRLPSEPHLAAFSFGGEIRVYQAGAGLLRMTESGPVLERPESALPERPLTWAVSLPDGSELDGLGEGAYRRTSAGTYQRQDALSAALKGRAPSRAVVLGTEMKGGSRKAEDGSIQPSRVAVGTFTGGIVLGSVDGGVQAVWNHTSGLPDDNITALFEDAAGSLWVGTGGGLARIAGPGEVSAFDARLGADDGAPRAVVARQGRVFALTSRTGYEITPGGAQGSSRMVPIPGLQSVLFGSAETADEWFVGGFGGLWRLGGTPAAPEFQQEVAVSTDIRWPVPSTLPGEELFFLEGYALKALHRSPHSGWAVRDLGTGVGDTPLSMLSDRSGNLWVSTVGDGIYRYATAASPEGSPSRLGLAAHYRAGVGLPAGIRNPVMVQAGGKVYAFADEGILRLDNSGGIFAPVPELADLAGVAATGGGKAGERTYWLVRAKTAAAPAPAALLELGTDGSIQRKTAPGLDGAGQPSGLSRVRDSAGDALWLSGSRAFLRIGMSALRPAAPPPALHLTGVSVNGEAAALAEGGRFSSNAAELEFRFAPDPGADDEGLSYATRLEGLGRGWSAPQRRATQAFTGLAPGEYRFEARAIDRFGQPGPLLSYAFGIPAPWWRSVPALAAWVLLAAAVATAGAWLRFRRLRRQNERLNRLVSERTRELELANTAKSEFLENISHELRNPLNGVNGLVGLLREDQLGPNERELARSLKASARQLVRAFEEVLSFSKIEYGCLPVVEAPFSLQAALTEAVDRHAAAAKEAGCELRLDMPASVSDSWFLGDAEKMKTIVSNFIGNAVKYAPGNPVDIAVQIEDGEVTLEVTDHGPGVPEEEQGLIFEKFVRGRGAKSAGAAGTGLGLAACRALAQVMGGSVGVDSEPGRGATFWLKMPLRRSDSKGQAGPHEAVPSSEAPAGRHPGAALVVDDLEFNRRVLASILANLGYEVEVAALASEAVSKAANRRFDLVFLDWELPDAKGGEAARQIRRLGGTMAIIATTAHDSPESRARCLQAGMDEFLLKPFSDEDVKGAIARTKSGAGAEAPTPPGKETGLNLRAFELYGSGQGGGLEAGIARCMETLDQEMEGLRGALGTEDRETSKVISHRIRSLAAMIGAANLRESARRLEEAPDPVPFLLEVEVAVAELRDRVRAIPGQNPSPSRTG